MSLIPEDGPSQRTILWGGCNLMVRNIKVKKKKNGRKIKIDSIHNEEDPLFYGFRLIIRV